MKTSYLIVGVALVLILVFATKSVATQKTVAGAASSNAIVQFGTSLSNLVGAIAASPSTTSTSSSGLTQLPAASFTSASGGASASDPSNAYIASSGFDTANSTTSDVAPGVAFTDDTGNFVYG